MAEHYNCNSFLPFRAPKDKAMVEETVKGKKCVRLSYKRNLAALEPIAEYILNKHITEYANGKTVIFISHRLSTTLHADRIYMFEDGRIIESGTHDKFMDANGKNAEMFNVQAKKT